MCYSGYTFPTKKGKHKEILYPMTRQDTRKHALLEILCDIIKNGFFVVTKELADERYSMCQYCEYKDRICNMYSGQQVLHKYRSDSPAIEMILKKEAYK